MKSIQLTLAACLVFASITLQAQETTAITQEGLKTILENMGYDPQLNEEGTYYAINVGSSTFTCAINAGITNNGENLWIYAYMAELPPAERIPASVSLGLLMANEQFASTYYSVAKDGDMPKWLYLNRVIRNDGIKPKLIRGALENMCEVIRSTTDLWDTQSWTQQAVN